MDATDGLSVTQEILSSDAIEIIVPSYAENGAIVQLEVHSHIPNSDTVAVLVDKNPTALIGNYLFEQGAFPWLVTRIKWRKHRTLRLS